MKKATSTLLVLCLLLGVCTACADRSTPGSAPRESSSSSLEAISSSPAPPEAEGDMVPEPDDVDVPDVTSPEEDAPDSPPEGTESDPEEKPLSFRLGPDGEVKALHAGDTLGGWTLESYEAVWEGSTDGLPDVDGANFTAPNDAPVELHCTVYLSPMGGTDGRSYWFDVAEEDYDKMPMMEGTDGRPRFRALDNAALGVLETMGYEDRWDCRVAVTGYIYYHLHMGTINGADVVRIELE